MSLQVRLYCTVLVQYCDVGSGMPSASPKATTGSAIIVVTCCQLHARYYDNRFVFDISSSARESSLEVLGLTLVHRNLVAFLVES